MGSVPSTRATTMLGVRALALTACVPLAALAIAAGGLIAGLATHDAALVVFPWWIALYLAAPGLWTLRKVRRSAGERPAGIAVDGDAEPALWRLVAEESRALGVPAPAHVRISLEHRIRVTRTGGERTLVLGAPLAFAVSEDVLRVAVAHALLRDGSALARLLDGWAGDVLERAHAAGHLPVVGPRWQAVARGIWPHVAAASRARVVLADRQCAARLGAGAAADHVRAQMRGDAFAAYWSNDVSRCLDAGFRPPILAGWRAFRGRPGVAEAISTLVAGDLELRGHPGDPEPTVGARLRAIELHPGSARDVAADATTEPATPPAALEAAALGNGPVDGALVELAWDRVGEAVWLPQLRTAAAPHRTALAGRTLADLPALARRAIADDLPAGDEPVPLGALGAALAVALADRGWRLALEPGGPLVAIAGEDEVSVLSVPDFLAEPDAGVDGGEDWQRLLDDHDLRDAPLVAAVRTGSVAPPTSWPTRMVAATVSLPRTRRLRRLTAVTLAVMGGLGVALCVAMGVLAFSAPTDRARVFFALVTPPATAALLWWLRWRGRVAFSCGSLSISEHGLRIEDRALLHAPLVIDRAQVRAVAVDDGDARSSDGSPLRFPFGASPWLHPSGREFAASGWLWSGAHAGSVPLLGAGDEVPNLLVLFSEPVSGPRLRRGGEGLPHPGATLGGLALRVGDSAAARAALAGWEAIRPLTQDDVVPETSSAAPAAAPAIGPRDPHAVRRARKSGWLLVAAGLIIPVFALLVIWEVAAMWETERRRAAVLGAAALTVVVVRLALFEGWI
jgi:hypothetical protein